MGGDEGKLWNAIHMNDTHLPAVGGGSKVGELVMGDVKRVVSRHLNGRNYTHSGLDSIIDILQQEFLIRRPFDSVARSHNGQTRSAPTRAITACTCHKRTESK
jgi:hypothetical protein